MPFDVDPIQLERILLVGAVLGLLVAALGVLGELVGWWDDVGELLVTTGMLASVVLGLGFGLANASRRQVESVREAVEGHGAMLTDVHRAVDGNGDKLDDVREAIAGENGVVTELDVVQAELDRQTGVLEEQLSVLAKIQDGFDAGGGAG
jgi:predicted negative regulator of RcsB-dependent stress response